MIWVLIFSMGIANGGSFGMIEFKTKEECEKGKQIVRDSFQASTYNHLCFGKSKVQ